MITTLFYPILKKLADNQLMQVSYDLEISYLPLSAPPPPPPKKKKKKKQQQQQTNKKQKNKKKKQKQKNKNIFDTVQATAQSDQSLRCALNG